MPLLTNARNIMRLSILLAPTIIMGSSLWETFINPSWKGPIFILGALLTTILGNIISKSFPNRVPGFRHGVALPNNQNVNIKDGTSMFDPGCNLIMNNSGGWGTFFSTPESHALFFAYAFVYLTAGMFLNAKINWLMMGIMIVLTISSGYIRTTSPLLCGRPIDLFFGYIGGIICGGLWYFTMYALENSSTPPLDLTYFNSNSDAQKCSLTNKKFVCTKTNKSKKK